MSTEVVTLSYGVFAVWWVVLLSVHLAVCVYNAIYAYYYTILADSYLNVLLDTFQIGMPPAYNNVIATTHAIMSALHGLCIIFMIGGSIWQHSLAFTPWSSCAAGPTSAMINTTRTSSTFYQKIYAVISDRRGILGVNGKYFHLILVFREILETALQTGQAFRMSKLLPRTILNRFYVFLLVVNCWSSAAVSSSFFKVDEARKRFTCLILDCALDLVACMGVQVIVVMSYAGDFDIHLNGLSYLRLYDDEWMARAFNEFQLVIVVSWKDLVSRVIFSFGVIMATINIKELLQHLPKTRNRVGPNTFKAVVSEASGKKKKAQRQASMADLSYGKNLLIRLEQVILRIAQLVFGVWGVVVLAIHIHASMRPRLPQCLMQVRPWMASRPSCYLAGLDCYTLGISGLKDEVDAKWSEFDSSTVVHLLIRHCPALEVPVRFTEFHKLSGIKVYNTTIKDWNESVAITNTNHPWLSQLTLVRVNMTDGLLPAGFQSTDFPSILYEINTCVTNLRELPDDLDTKWIPQSILQVEYAQFTEVPRVLLRAQPIYLALTGNPITQLPPEIFEVDSIYILGISDMNIRELPHNVTKLSENLKWVFMRDTDISFFWSWADELVTRWESRSAPWIAGYSTYCDDLAKIQNGSANGFRVSLSSEYSQTLMDSSDKNLQVISKAVNCKAATRLPSQGGMFYPLATEDSINAISTPPSLARQM